MSESEVTGLDSDGLPDSAEFERMAAMAA